MRKIQIEVYRPVAPEEPATYWERLSELAAILHGLPWALAGGMSVPATTGAFYRPHHDVDIIFPENAFPEVEAAMRRGGFVLRTHFAWSLFGRVRGAVHVSTTATGALVRHRMRKLKFRDMSGRRRPPFAIVEAFPYRIENGRLVTCDGRHRIPLSKPIIGHRRQMPCGHEIPCFDLDYVAHCKRGKGDSKDVSDLRAIAAFRRPPLPAAG